MGGARSCRQARGIRDDEELAEEWRTTAEEIREDILAHGVSERGVLRQHYDTDALDASILLAALFGFLPGTDERLRNTVDAIEKELTENGFVLRYRTDETDDGLSGKEGTFLICSYWLVSALAVVGEMDRARSLMERLLRIASPLGLYAEEFEVERARHLGNFPQAFSHLALLDAAARIILSDLPRRGLDMTDERPDRRPHVVISRRRTGRRRLRPPTRRRRRSRSPSSTATTTTSSSRCCTRWRRHSCPPGTSPAPIGPSSATTRRSGSVPTR